VIIKMVTKIPLNLRLKRKEEKDIAYAQDIIVEQLYKFFPKAIIHGGTAIWRCYQGNRFSEDVDAYIPRDEKTIYEFINSLRTRGFNIVKTRIKENSVYTELDFNRITTKFEATFQNKKPFLKGYETSDSLFINIYTLTAEELIIEKVETYLSRKKIRDLYDLYFLLTHHIENNEQIKKNIRKLITNYKKPLDEANLANIILSGIAPDSEYLFNEIKKWAK